MSHKHAEDGIEDSECLPEYLLTCEPVKDSYSSDEEKDCCRKTSEAEKDKEHPAKSTIKRREENPVKLHKHTNSSDLSAAEVLFFFDLDYFKSPSCPEDFTQATVEQILEALLKFSFKDKDDEECEFKVCGKTVPELYQETLKKCPFLLWMKENDDINLKTCKPQDVLKKSQDFKTFRKPNVELLEQLERDQTFAVMDFIETIMLQYKKNGLNDYHLAKSIFQSLGYLLPRGCFIKFNGNYRINYLVSEEIASDTPPSNLNIYPEGDRECVIGVHPDTVFVVGEIDKIAVEVFAPQKGSSSSASEDEVTFSSEHSLEQAHVKPLRERDAILKKDYRTAANNFLKQFVPNDCKDAATLNKLLGEHLVQLITLAMKSIGKIKDRSRKDILGMFMKNEYMFLTKLAINDAKLLSYSPLIDTNELIFLSPDEMGKFTIANWRIDLTQENHRIAFVTFLVLFCKMFQLELVL